MFATVYDVRIRYSVDDRAAAGVRRTVGDVRELGRETGRAAAGFRAIGAAVVGAFSVRAGAKALVGFNATVEDTKLQIAGMLALTKKTDLSDQVGRADRLFANLQQRAKSLPGTTQEYTRMAGMLTQPITDAGLGMQALEDLTVNVTVAAKALGYQWDLAARDVDQALRGQFHSTDPFSGKVLGAIGYKGEEGRSKYNALSADMRASEYQRALMLKQWDQLGKASGQTFSGALSTLQSTIEEFAGKVGLPLFKAITAEIKQWNTWLDTNQGKLTQWATTFGDGLVTGFRAVKDSVGFLVDHADTLMAIGKVWLAVRVGSAAGGMLQSLGARGAGGAGALFGAGGFFSRGKAASDKIDPFTGEYSYTPAVAPGRGRSAVGGIKGAMGSLPLLGQSLAAGYAIGTLINDATGLSTSLSELINPTDANTKRFRELELSSLRLRDAMDRAAQGKTGFRATSTLTNMEALASDKEMQANLVMDAVRALRAFGASGSLADQAVLAGAIKKAQGAGLSMEDINKAGGPEAFAQRMMEEADALRTKQGVLTGFGGAQFDLGVAQLTDYQRQTLDVQTAQVKVLEYLSQQIAKGEAFQPAKVMEILKLATDDPSGKRKISSKPNVNITIQRIEVQSDDPDRYAFGLVEAFRDAVKNPSQAVRTAREG